MPNHVTTRMVVTGAESSLQVFETTHIVEETLDFNTIIPIPSILNGVEASTRTTDGMVALAGVTPQTVPNRYSPKTLEGYLKEYRWHERGVTTQEQMWEWLVANSPGSLVQGARALKAIKETGYSTWYDWNIAKWGTKWNAYEVAIESRTPGMMMATFQTAWDFPEPIFVKLAALYPDLCFSAVCFDEGWNFEGHGTFHGQECRYESKPATKETYEKVYGEPFVEEEEEEGVQAP